MVGEKEGQVTPWWVVTRTYIKMQLALLAKKLIHRTTESEEADR